jgi:hypothetical protein
MTYGTVGMMMKLIRRVFTYITTAIDGGSIVSGELLPMLTPQILSVLGARHALRTKYRPGSCLPVSILSDPVHAY